MSENDQPQSPVADASATMANLTEFPPPPAPGGMPPNPPAPASPPTGEKDVRKPPPNVAGKVDKDGRAFDWDLHEVDAATGKARIGVKGQLLFKRGNNFKARDKATVAEPPPADQQPEQVEVHRREQEGEDPEQRFGRAAALVNVFEKASKALLGSDWELAEIERAELAGATDLLFEKYGSLVLPPEGLLAVALGGVVLSRIGKPETQKRLARFRNFLARGGPAEPPKAQGSPAASPSAGASGSAPQPASLSAP